MDIFCDKNLSNNWTDLSYAGECRVPIGEEPMAFTWPLCFLKRSIEGLFLNSNNEIIPFDIKEPDMTFNFKEEMKHLYHVQDNLTEEQIKIAKYWGDGPPSKQFMPIADILIDTYSVSACRANRIYYILNGALNDACIVAWYFKYKWNILRPNQYNQCFASLLCTPRHPSYPAGHSVTAGCMAEILSYFFPKEREKLEFCSKQCSDSRVYGGVHYRFDCDEGLKLGVSIAKVIIDEINLQADGNGVRIDIPYVIYKDADIIPESLEQYIPFDRKSKCSSLTLD